LWVYMFYECLFPAMDPWTSINRYIIWHTDKKAGIPELNINTVQNNVWISICANDKASNSTDSSLALRNIKNSRISHKNTMILLSHKAHTPINIYHPWSTSVYYQTQQDHKMELPHSLMTDSESCLGYLLLLAISEIVVNLELQHHKSYTI
jgi:hypothetical protein